MTTPETRNSGGLATGALILRVRAGGIEFYAELIRRYQPVVLRVVSAMLYDRNATQELAQNVLVDAYLHLDGFDESRDFGPWIRTIARNAVREHLRKTSRYSRRLQVYADTLEARLADDGRASEHEEHLRELLAICLGKLPDRLAAIVSMRYQQGRSFEQMAANLGTFAGALRSRAEGLDVSARAMAHIRNLSLCDARPDLSRASSRTQHRSKRSRTA